MQLIPSGLGDKSQCADAAGLFWQPRWLGSPLHFDKMSSGHGSVHCLLLFIFLFSFSFLYIFCHRSVMLFTERSSNNAGEQRAVTKGEKTPHVNWGQAGSIRPSALALRNLQPEPSSHVQTTSLLHHRESVWYTLFDLEMFEHVSLFLPSFISQKLNISLFLFLGPTSDEFVEVTSLPGRRSLRA